MENITKKLNNFEADLHQIVGDKYIRYFDEEEDRTYFLVTDEELFWGLRDKIHEADMKYFDYMAYYGIGYDITGLRYQHKDESVCKTVNHNQYYEIHNSFGPGVLFRDDIATRNIIIHGLNIHEGYQIINNANTHRHTDCEDFINHFKLLTDAIAHNITKTITYPHRQFVPQKTIKREPIATDYLSAVA